MNKIKAINIIVIAKKRAIFKTKYYSLKNKEIAQMWRDKIDAFELARRALLKEVEYEKRLYEIGEG